MFENSALLSGNVRSRILRIIAVVLIFCFLLTGCSIFSKSDDTSSEANNPSAILDEPSAVPTFKPIDSTDQKQPDENPHNPVDEDDGEVEETQRPSILTEEELQHAEQLRSFSMMYYLAITAEDIRTSKDNRLLLDDIYTSLLNDINPRKSKMGKSQMEIVL